MVRFVIAIIICSAAWTKCLFMSVYHLKSQFQDKLRPVSDALVTVGVTANQVTISAIVLSAGTAYIIATANEPPESTELSKSSKETNRQVWWVLPLSLFGRMALNAIDGMMAREHHQASRRGAILNEAGDIVSDSLLIASLAPHIYTFKSDTLRSQTLCNYTVYRQRKLSNHTHLHIINSLSTLTELIAIASNLAVKQRANHGPLGKSDRALELGIIGALTALNISHNSYKKVFNYSQNYVRPLMWLNELLLIKTCLNRLAFIATHYFNHYHPEPRLKISNLSPLYASTFSNVHATSNIELSNKIELPSVISTFTSTNLQGCTAMSSPSIKSDNKKNTKAYILDIKDSSKPNDDSKSEPKTSPVIAEQSCFNAYDGTAIYYRYWLTMPLLEVAKHSSDELADQKQSTQKQVILLHRGHEHSGRLSELGKRFAQAGYQVFAWDARGNGRSGGIKDHADSVTELERDLNDFVNLVIAQTGIAIEDTLIVASSIGAVLAAAWVHDYAPTIRGMILGTPALSIRLYIPLAIPTLKLARKFGLMSRVSSYVKAQVLTHDKEAQAAYNSDPLISGSISSDLLIDTHATGQRLLDDAGAITAPTFILCAGKDYVVEKQAERTFYEQLSSKDKRWQLYPDSFHAIFHETNKVDIFEDCIGFADNLFAQPVETVDLTAAHNDSASKDKVDRLAIKPFNPSFAITRFAMQKFGHVSEAIATGLEHGFDSGSSLDKVYANTPTGKNAFGKAVDKFYLSNIGWQGIRIRRQHILALARMAINERLQAGTSSEQTIRVLDIASGNGYYVFDLLAEFEALHAELRDYDTHNVKVLGDKAEKLDMSSRVQAVKKDAFDSDSYGYSHSENNLFDMAIASGVFELFSDNTLVSTALKGIFDSLANDGYLLYTNQPWHPEQEFISKTLNNHRGSSWVMRCRSQAEMDQLVTQAGFQKLDMRIDRFGIFTVSLAIKRG